MRYRKRVSKFLKRLLRTRKIIIVSDDAVDYYPLGRMSQLLLITGFIGFVSWASYSTGSFMAAKSQIAEKEREIESAISENRKIEEEFALLKRDLMRVKEKSIGKDGEGLSDYAKFVIEQYENDSMAGMKGLAFRGGSMNPEQDMLFERMNFLEKQIEELKEREELFIRSIRKRTRGEIKALEDIIKLTGLPKNRLKKAQARLTPPMKMENEFLASDYAEGEEESGKGGPFIPNSGDDAVMEEKRQAIKEIEELVLLNNIVEKLPLAEPMKGGRLTSGFGTRIDPFNRNVAHHSGQDFAGPIGSRVRASGKGKVIYAARKGAYGNTVEISHGFGLVTRYAHLSKIMVKEGQWVNKYQTIGIQGTTGRSTGHHLHYEVRKDNVAMNPMRFIKAGRKYVQN